MFKLAAWFIIAMYLIVGYILEGPQALVIVALWSAWPLFCVYFGDAMGKTIFYVGAQITDESPGAFVKFLGLVILLTLIPIYILIK